MADIVLMIIHQYDQDKDDQLAIKANLKHLSFVFVIKKRWLFFCGKER